MLRRALFFCSVIVVVVCGYRAVQAVGLATIANLDLDANGKADLVFFKPIDGKWYVMQAPTYNSAFSIASASSTIRTDTLVPIHDYNGDGFADVASYRTTTQGPSALVGTWTITLGPKFDTATAIQWGAATDVPLPADWDGNGKIDAAVWRPADQKLYVLQGPTFNSAFTLTFGRTGDTALPGDYDLDGRVDFAVYRPADGRVYVLQSGFSFTTAFSFVFGLPGQTLIQGDFDGDGILDLAAYDPVTSGGRPAGTWTIIQGGARFTTRFAVTWGVAGDIPLAGDWDGNGKLDIAFWRPWEARYYILQQNNGYHSAFSVPFGTASEVPFPIGVAQRATL